MDLPRDEEEDAAHLQQWQLVKTIAFLQLEMAHERTLLARAEGDDDREGANAEMTWDWTALWKDMSEEEQELEAWEEAAAARESAKARRKGRTFDK